MRKIIITMTVVLAMLTACGNLQTQNNESMNTQKEKKEEGIFPLGQVMPENFTGTVHYQPLVGQEDMEGLYTVGQVSFSPGARTHWHRHPAGQVLLVTNGRGWYQERGKDAVPLLKGSVINIPRDVDHWHGASAGEGMTHIAISNFSEGSNVTWIGAVTDPEYGMAGKASEE